MSNPVTPVAVPFYTQDPGDPTTHEYTFAVKDIVTGDPVASFSLYVDDVLVDDSPDNPFIMVGWIPEVLVEVRATGYQSISIDVEGTQDPNTPGLINADVYLSPSAD